MKSYFAKRKDFCVASAATACILLTQGGWALAGLVSLQLPAETDFNKDAGRGNQLFLKLSLNGRKELSLIVDTGAPVTLLDQSLELELGQRLGTTPVNLPRRALIGWKWVRQDASIFSAPKLSLGDAPVAMGTDVLAGDLKPISSRSRGLVSVLRLDFLRHPHPRRRVDGILGMDCLRHYCIQLDFEAGKMRFLDSNRLNIGELGKAYPLTLAVLDKKRDLIRPFIHHTGLLGGTSTNAFVDTGCNFDGFVEKKAVKKQSWGWLFALFKRGLVSECTWDGGTYTSLRVGVGNPANLFGLRFLARHLVTLDFPNQILYLKQQRTDPLPDLKN